MTDSARTNSGDDPRDLAFFGRITASVTHELNNVISIIEQNTGLLSDLIAGEERGIPISTERLAGVAEKIQKQTRRGLGIIERLNRYAHTTDHDTVEYDVTEVIANLVELSRRLVQRKKLELLLEPAESDVRAIGNPFALQHAVFGALMLALEAGETESELAVGIRLDDNHPAVYIKLQGDADIVRDGLRPLQAMAGIANAEADVQEENGFLVVTVRLR